MPTPAEIERLSALVEQLLPLRSRARGEVIAAADWNMVVGALLEVARSVVAGATTAIPDHDHTDQVKAGWLDPTLRARLERGALDDPAAVGRVTALEGHLSGLRRDLSTLGADLAAARSATARVETSDKARESAITQLGRRVDGAAAAGDDVRELRTTLASLRGDLDLVSEVAGGLQVDGRTVNLAEIAGRVGQLERLRDRLTMPTGELLDVAEIERRITELRTTLVTEDELTDALRRTRTRVPDEVFDAIVERARGAAREEVDSRTASLGDELRAGIDERLVTVEARAVDAAVARSNEVAEGLRSTLGEELRAEHRAGDDAVRAEAAAGRDELATSIRADVDVRLSATDERISATVVAELDRLGPGLTADLTARVDTLAGDLAPLAERAMAAERNAADALAMVSGLDRREVEARDVLAAELRSDLATGLRATRDEVLAADADGMERLRGELARDRRQFSEALEDVRRKLPQLVDDRVRVTRDEVLAAVRTEVDALRPDLTRLVDNRISDEVARLRDSRIVTDRVTDPIRDHIIDRPGPG